MLEFLPRIALGFDLELSNLLQRLLTGQGMTFHLEAKVTAVNVNNGGATVTATKEGQELKFDADKVLVSVGRRPFSDGLGAEKVGVALDEKKRIKVDKHFRTNVEGIYAIGDVIAGPMLAHKAEDEGIACMEIIAGKAGHVNYEAIAGIIYTNPELAGLVSRKIKPRSRGSRFASANSRSAPTAARSAAMTSKEWSSSSPTPKAIAFSARIFCIMPLQS